ncbi:MAG TPA: L-lactate dehydrogenase [Candidatus Hydrogenedentes bacterium]|nr:L-lactate dehydrogenase [Candidatus Hydrogenedentota bacterium]
MIQKRTVGILGAGKVGMAAAYGMFNADTVSEMILVDKDEQRAEGEAMDLMHGASLAEPVTVRSGSFASLGSSQLVVVSAGTGRKPGETRLDLLNRNVAIFREIVAELDRHAPNAILVVATNPVDIITHVIQQLSQRPRSRVIGTGTMLDTSRFRALLGQHYGVDPRSVHAYILGEHGDSEVPIWSNASIGGLRLRERPVLGKSFDEGAMNALFERVRFAGREVIARKGFTSSAIGIVIQHLCETILDDQRTVLTVSVPFEGEYGIEGVCMSLPCVVGQNGIEGRIVATLSDEETVAMRHSASVIKESMQGISLA